MFRRDPFAALGYQGSRVAFGRYGAPTLRSRRNLLFLGVLGALLIAAVSGVVPVPQLDAGLVLGVGLLAPFTADQIRALDLPGVKARGEELQSALEELDAEAEWTDEQKASFEALSAEVGHLEARRKDIETRATIRARAESLANVEPGEGLQIRVAKTAEDAFDLRTLSFTAGPDEVRARAITAIEKMPEVPDADKQRMTKVVQRLPLEASRRLLLTSSMAYRKASQKVFAGQTHLLLPEEQQAIRAALSTTDGNGGFAVPFNLDPTVISTKNVTTNPFRRISRVVTGVTESWNGVASSGVTASFDTEGSEVSDDSPTLTQPAITAYMARAYAFGSIEIAMDWAAIEEELRGLFMEAKDDLEGSTMALGTGSGQPFGIVTAIAGTASEINAAADDTFAIGDVYSVEGALPAKYRLSTLDDLGAPSSRASWVANHAIYNLVRRFDTAGGAGLWEYLGGGRPARLLGHAAYEASGMDSTVTTSGAVSNFILLIGDFRYYVIYDRIGFNLEYIQHVVGTNHRPTGQRGWFGYWRVGADSVNDDAFRLLDVPSAA